MKTNRSTKAAVSILALVLAGCSTSGSAPPAEKLVPVSGTVKIGGKPAAGVRVLFVPRGSTTGNGAFALTDEEGNYELVHNTTQEPGVPTGEYGVQFSKFLMEDGSPVPEGQSPYMVNGRESIPAAYSDAGMTGPHNTVSVPEGGKTFDFDIPAQ